MAKIKHNHDGRNVCTACFLAAYGEAKERTAKEKRKRERAQKGTE